MSASPEQVKGSKQSSVEDEEKEEAVVFSLPASCNSMSASPEQIKGSKESSVEDEEKEEAVALSLPSASCNPDATDVDLVDRIRGDAIGKTVYSERFVLSALLKLASKLEEKNVELDEELENELCSLWDMTVEPDVVKLLLEHNVIDLFSTMVSITDDKRLTEILVGMIANMCSNNESTRDILRINSTAVNTLLELTDCSDSLTLMQLMRLLEVMIYTENLSHMRQWFACFRQNPNVADNFSYILSNSINLELLRQTLKTLCSILITFTRMCTLDATGEELSSGFVALFVRDSIISGTIEAAKTLMPEQFNSNEMDADREMTSEHSQRTVLLFLKIHCVLSQWDEASSTCYSSQMSSFLQCLARIISAPMQSESDSQYKAEIVECMNDIVLVMALGNPFHEEYLMQIAEILEAMFDEKTMRASRTEDDFDNDDTDDINRNTVSTLLDIIARCVQSANIQQIQTLSNKKSPRSIVKLLNALRSGDPNNDIKKCCALIMTSSYDNMKGKDLK